MQQIFCGKSGEGLSANNIDWQDLNLDPVWQKAIALLAPATSPRQVQVQALGELRILDSRRNLIVSAPTNSGKSLVGLLVLLNAILNNRRAILIEPLRALAREKTDELELLAKGLSKLFDKKIAVRISTGDYRIESELPSDPPAGGEIIVATPERLEALLRNPAHRNWLSTIGAVCVDEAHLIGSQHRGATLECLITSLLCLAVPPRLVLLSATLGNPEKIQSWLSPCDIVSVNKRQPPLAKWVLALDSEEDANTAAANWIEDQLQVPDSQALIFVYQTKSAEKLATFLHKERKIEAIAYHAKMSQAQREKSRQQFVAGEARVIVTTTALAMGINLPATHVLVRDSTFPMEGAVKIGDLLQMMGRAGRGNREGVAAVLVREGESWTVETLTEALRNEELPAIASVFEQGQGLNRSFNRGSHKNAHGDSKAVPSATTFLASLLSRWDDQGATLEQLQAFFWRSLGGQQLVSQVPSTLRWLEGQTLAYCHPELKTYHLTVLGKKATLAVLPLPLASAFGQLIRDLLTVEPIDPKYALLKEWRSLDFLLVIYLLSERSPSLRRYSVKLVEAVDSWNEANPNLVPFLFHKWMRGKVGFSKANEVLGSLGLHPPKSGKLGDEWAVKLSYQAMFHAIVLWERSQGGRMSDIERRFKVEGLEGIEERWRDELLWLLSGVVKLLDVRTFYYHLREDCRADSDRIKRVKGYFAVMELQVYDLMEQLKFCSPLGSVLCDMRRLAPQGKLKIGVRSIRTLEESGIESLKDLAMLSVEDLVKVGVQRKVAERLRGYLRKRSL